MLRPSVHTVSRLVSLLSLGLLLATGSACVGSDELEAEALDELEVFEGRELAADPDARLFVDLRGEQRYAFDQRALELDFDRFLVQCPTMPAPMPMPAFLDALDIDPSAPYWTLESDLSRELEQDADFRALCLEEERHCPNGQDRGDCVWVCVLEADEAL